MFITKKQLARRTVLRGMGATVALPFLDAMVSAQTPIRKSAAMPRPRLAALEMVHGSAGATLEGARKGYWSPAAEGPNFEFTSTLKSLEPYRDYLTIISNTDQENAAAATLSEEGGDHNRSTAVFLTAARPKLTEGSDILAGTSLDQYYAQEHGRDTPLQSIQLCIENVDGTGACGYGYACVYADTISWASPTRPLPMERDPRRVFERLFGAGGTPEERRARQQVDRSILDVILEDVERLRVGLGASDRARLSSYLDDIREVEQRIERIEAYNAQGHERALPEAPLGVPDSFGEHAGLMFDLQALAFMADITRVSSFKLGRDASNRVFPESGVNQPFHSLSHHGYNPETVAEFAKLNAYHVAHVAPFLEKLKSTPDGDGNLLDHTLVIYGSPMGDSNIHEHKRCPLFLAGHASGRLGGNMHLRCKEGTPMANVWLTLLHKLDVKVESIGDSTGYVSL
ncbi:MAG: DUF1552 domain-containing protein [Vicinamibacterales bacterium]